MAKQESSVVRAVVELVELRGGHALKVLAGKYSLAGGGWAVGAKAGNADVLALYKGNYIQIEVKKDKKAVTAWENHNVEKCGAMKGKCNKCNQRKMKQTVEAIGGHYWCVGDIGSLSTHLDNIDRELKTT